MAPAATSKPLTGGDKHNVRRAVAAKAKRATNSEQNGTAEKPSVTPLVKRGGRTDTLVDHPPPPYTPSIALHASTIPYDGDTAGSPTSMPLPTNPAAIATPAPHGANVGLLVGAVIAGALLLLLVALMGRYLVHRRAGKIQLTHPRFSMLVPGQNPKPKMQAADTPEPEKVQPVSGEFGQFVYISTSEGEIDMMHAKEDEGGIETDQPVPPPRDSLHPDSQPDFITRRYSSPAALGENRLRASASSVNITGMMTASRSAPASPNLSGALDRETSLWIQRQKAAELAQIVRMRIVRDEMPVHKAVSCQDFQLDDKQASSSVLLNHGLGIMREDHEVDIAGTAIAALQRYSVVVDPLSPNIPVTQFFQIDRDGKVLRLPNAALATPTSADITPTTPMSPSSSGGSSFSSSEECTEEVETAVIVRMAQTRSMEIKRGTLISVNIPDDTPPVSRSAPMLLDAQSAPLEKSAFPPTPPPTLSPIVTSPTSLTADIEQSLESRVFAYRDSGAWSKQHYKLTTPGQVRALVESLAIARPVSVHEQLERGWPWPAHRSSVISR